MIFVILNLSMCVDTILKKYFSFCLLIFAFWAMSFQAQSQGDDKVYSLAKQTIQLAIIIDDIGAKPSDAKAFYLPKSVTFSILPHTEYSTAFSYRASQQNREVMLHMPMESLHAENLGPGALLANMYPKQITSALLNALETVPHAVGVNNHMGSKLTQMTLQLTSVMQELEANNLFFVDSRTTRFSKATLIAKQQGVKTASRHVFLDHVQNIDFLEHQFALALKQAKRDKKAILIAHPYPVTLDFLQRKIATLPSYVELITVSEYLQERDKFRINPRLVETQEPLIIANQAANISPEE